MVKKSSSRSPKALFGVAVKIESDSDFGGLVQASSRFFLTG